ncbi:MAG TPA: S8 family serine peptidase [Pseudomonadales bacterium]
MRRYASGLAVFVLLSVSNSLHAADSDRYLRREVAPERLEALRLTRPLTIHGAQLAPASAKIHPSLRGARGTRKVIVRLRSPSAARMADRSRAAVAGRKWQLMTEQDAFIRRSRGRAAFSVIGQTQLVLNAVFAEVDAGRLDELAQDPMVERITPAGEYRKYLHETVPYIGAAAVQAAGIDGDGVRVAVLDSGIDYTHADLGGTGTVEAYEAAHSDPVNPAGFPTERVVGGFDFVGENWAGGDDPLEPDPDPIDTEGHGTHVAAIIGGRGGVAPAVDLYAVKVCSAVSTSCSGVALIQGLEFAVDPNGDGDPEDAVDIVNMSLGADYGQPFDDDLSQAVEGATRLGVLSVAAAGNAEDKPYVLGTPAAAPSALAVAQTHVPSATQPLIRVNGAGFPAVFQSWSTPPAGVIQGPLLYGDGAGGNLDGCAPFAPGSLAGAVVLVDRGTCNFTAKIFNIQNGGGAAGIIGLVAPGVPFVGGFADPGGQITIPGYMVSLDDANAMRAALPATAVIDPADGLELIGTMVGTSSRGPQHEHTTLVKPEIGAPGASVSAEVGTGDRRTPFGGTSGATPMVTGAAALLLQAEPWLRPPEVKARLVNTAFTDIDTSPGAGPAPITRIGGGEVRVDAALATKVAAWEHESLLPSLSFGFDDTARHVEVIRRLVRVRNYSNRNLWLAVDAQFRFGDDAENGAVSLHTLPRLFVGRRSEAWLPVWIKVRGNALRGNAMNSGGEGNNPAALTLNEYDGYLRLEGSGVALHLPWHLLPRQAADVHAPDRLRFGRDGTDRVTLVNRGVGTAQNDAYSLLAVSGNLPEGGAGEGSPTPDLRAVGIGTIPVPAGFCSANESFVWQFAITTWERQQHLLPVSHQVWLDIDRDGTDDYVVLNRDFSGFNTIVDGRQLTWALNLATGTAQGFFFAEHATNTANTVLRVCAEQVGLGAADLLTTRVGMAVVAQDFYHGGPGDEISGLTVTPLGERFVGFTEDVPGLSRGTMEVVDFGPFEGNSAELGILLFTNGDRGPGARGGATPATEALLIRHRDAVKGHPGKGKG